MNNRLFHDWVSPKTDMWLLIFMSLSIGFTSGLSSSISSYSVSDLAIDPSYASMCSYAYAGGMAASFTVFNNLSNYFSAKQILIASALLLMFLNFILTETDSGAVVVMITFLIGAVRLIGIIVVVVNLIPILMPKGERYKLYCVYYPISLMVSLISGFFQVRLADKFGWHFSFHVSNLTLFFVLLTAIIGIKNKYPKRRIPLWKFDWFGFCLMSGWILAFSYTVAYGRTRDWFSGNDIVFSATTALILLLLFLLRNEILREKILNLKLFLKRNVRVGLTIMFFFNIFYALTSPLSSWMNIAFKTNPLKYADVNTYPIAGYILGAVMSFMYYHKYQTFKPMILFSTFCYVLSSVMFYFLIDTQTSPAQMFFPLAIRGIAIISSYITIGMYTYVGLNAAEISKVAAILIFIRSYLGPTFWAGIYASWLYYRPIQMTDKLASYSDAADPLFQLRFHAAHSPNADPVNAYKTLRLQATLVSVKELLGWVCLFGIGMLVFLIFFPIYKKPGGKLFDWRKKKNNEDIATAAAA